MDKYHLGSTDFNSTDRLAILNLLNGVTQYYDNYAPEGLDNYISCYTDDGVFILRIPGKEEQKAYKSPDSNQTQTGMKEFFGTRIASFVENGIQNRHNFTNKTIIKQGLESAEAVLNLLFVDNHTYLTKTDQPYIPLKLVMSAQYHIKLVKLASSWYIKEMVAQVDNTDFS